MNLNTTSVALALVGVVFILAATGDMDPRDVIRTTLGKARLYTKISEKHATNLFGTSRIEEIKPRATGPQLGYFGGVPV